MIDRELERACAIVAFKDAQPLRRALFAKLASRRPMIRAALAVWERLGASPAATAFVSALAAKAFLEVRFPADGRVLAVSAYPNEARQFRALQALDPTLSIKAITLDPAAIRAGAPVPPLSDSSEAWSLVHRYARQGDFLVAARVASTVGYYLRMRRDLERSRARVVLVSSDTNPYAVALAGAARALRRKTCFVTHGHVAEGPPALDFDLSLLDGPAVLAVYERAGPVRGEVVYKGAEGATRPMDTSGLKRGVRTLGVFVSILVDWRRLGPRIAELRRVFRPESVLLRLHPNPDMRAGDWSDHVDLGGVQISEGDRAITDDAGLCDLVAAGNSSAHLSVLKYGVPTIYVPGLDEAGEDYYGFVSDGLLTASVEPREIAAFYEEPGWARRFARFDAGWPDRQGECDLAVTAALRRLLEEA